MGFFFGAPFSWPKEESDGWTLCIDLPLSTNGDLQDRVSGRSITLAGDSSKQLSWNSTYSGYNVPNAGTNTNTTAYNTTEGSSYYNILSGLSLPTFTSSGKIKYEFDALRINASQNGGQSRRTTPFGFVDASSKRVLSYILIRAVYPYNNETLLPTLLTWHHVKTEYDYSAGIVDRYVNDTLQVSVSCSFPTNGIDNSVFILAPKPWSADSETVVLKNLKIYYKE